MMFLPLLTILTTAHITLAAVLQGASTNVHLAVSPKCGDFTGSPADVNAGLRPLNSYKTIVSFGDSYTDGGVRDGSPLKPAILSPPNPNAGGRISNGPVWVEHLAANASAVLEDYAFNGAVIDASQYPSVNFNGINDFIGQVNLFTGQGNRYDPNTTLYVIFFGMGDFAEKNADLTVAAENIIYHILGLLSSPIFARHFLVLDNYGRGIKTDAGESFKRQVYAGLKSVREVFGANVAFVDFATIWNGVLGSNPGYKAFGYTNPGACTVNDETTVGACSDPDHSFYWIPGMPSRVTHSIMATYVQEVLAKCKAS